MVAYNAIFNIVLLCVLLSNVEANDSIREDHEINLNEEYDVVLKWRIDADDIYFEMSAKTQGYIAIGFSPNGGMPGSDVVVGWVKNGKAFLSDRYAVTFSRPLSDNSNDYKLLYGFEESGKTTIGFTRKLQTCDPNDYTISTDTARIIWALNDEDPDEADGDDIRYHEQSRGVRSVILLNANKKPGKLPENVEFFDITMPNVTVPSDKDTTYWCTAFEVPSFEQPVHVVRFDGLVQKGHEAVVHHMVVYGCRGNISAVLGWSTECDSEIMPPDISECQKIIYAWAIGSKPFEFPEHVGFPLGGEEDPTFLVIEMHYDNPAFSPGFHDNSGLRIFFTPTLREYIADVWMVGEDVSTAHMIPPNESEFETYGICYSECTRAGMSSDFYVIGALLHGHLAAHKISLQQWRGDKLVDEIRDDNYDFNLQESRILATEKTFKPGDAYVVTCSYNTIGRYNITVGGEGTNEEMCLAFVYYYPRQSNITFCVSSPSLSSIWQIFEIPYDYKHDYGDFYGYTYWYLTNEVESDRLRVGLKNVTDKAMRYNLCLSAESGFIGEVYEVDFPEWFTPGTRLPVSNNCNEEEEPNGMGCILKAGYLSFFTAIGYFIIF